MPELNFVDNFIPHPSAGGRYDGGDVLGTVRNSRGGGLDSRNFANLRRPFLDNHDRPCVRVLTGRFTINKGQRAAVRETRYIHDLERRGWRIPITANATTLRKEEWLELDRVVLRAARLRLRAWADIAAANSYGGFNGMAKTTLEHETMSDPGEAIVDMDALTEGRTDAPLFQLEGLPLPITHSDFWYSSRFLAESRNSGTPLDVVSGEAAGRRVGEMIEKTTIGMTTGITGTTNTLTGGYGRTPKVYGMINFPARLTMTTLHTPTGANPDQTLADVLAMRQQLYNGRFYGPFMLYHTNDWDTYMDNDYARAVVGATSIATSKTLRDRLRDIDDIQDVRRLDFFFGAQPGAGTGNPYSTQVDAVIKPYQLVMLQMTPDVVQAVNGLDITTVQWETVGGMKVNFKVLCINVPRFRADFYGNCFAGETRIITRGGNKTLRELDGQRVEVLNRFGKWETASVQSFGIQRLQKISFNHLNPVLATAEHRWWQKDGTRVTTMEVTQIPFTDETLGHATVKSVIDTGRNEEVFCCICPDSESFTLANGLVTSNCGEAHGTTS